MLTAAHLQSAGLVAIIRASSPQGVLEAAHALRRGGVRAMEITLNTPGALELVAQIRAEAKAAEAQAEAEFGVETYFGVGAGTILDADEARRAIDAGAQFLVTPTVQLDSIAVCRGAKIPILCGAMTPTECLAAHRAGADFVKLFPAAAFEPEYVRALLGPLPMLKLVPTGGVSLQNMAAWFEAGSAMVAVGSDLVDAVTLRNRDFTGLENKARRWIETLSAARSAARSEAPSAARKSGEGAS